MAGRHVEMREIDYAEVLRERSGGDRAAWEKVIANCLQGDAFELDEETIKAMLEIAGDEKRLGDLVSALEARAGESGGGVGARTAALLKMLHGVLVLPFLIVGHA